MVVARPQDEARLRLREDIAALDLRERKVQAQSQWHRLPRKNALFHRSHSRRVLAAVKVGAGPPR